MSARKYKKNSLKAKEKREAVQREIFGIALLAFALLLFLGLLGFENGAIGAIGSVMIKFLKITAGRGAVAFPIFIAFGGFVLFINRESKAWNKRLTGLFIIFISILAFIHLELPFYGFKEYIIRAWQGDGGGILGGLASYFLRFAFGQWGSIIVLSSLSIIGLLLITQISLGSFFNRLGKALCGLFSFLNPDGKEISEDIKSPSSLKPQRLKGGALGEAENESLSSKSRPLIISHEDRVPPTPVIDSKGQALDDGQAEAPKLNKFAKEYMPTLSKKGQNIAEKTGLPHTSDEAYPIDETQKEGSLTNEGDFSAPGGENTPAFEGEYKLPYPELISAGIKIKNPRMNKAITDAISILEETLDNFGVKAKVSQVVAGPAVTRYELQPAPGVKVSRITSLADDIALSLAASEVRIEAPIPGKSAVGIEIPRAEIATVYFRDVIGSPEFSNSNSRLSFALGKNISGEPIIGDLSKMPHLLIAGATGSGKSICINSIICSMLYKAKPNEVKFMLIDPKKVELAGYNKLPHLITPVVTDNKKAAGCLKWVVKEMEDRYSLFAGNRVKDFNTYNEKYPEAALPQMVVIIDELADLMMVAPADVEESICRLAQMARAAGIHLIVATQRPSVDVITGLIKANIPSRIAFAVSSYTDSRTILDMAGAEKLLGRGDMLYHPVGIPKPIRIQGTYIEEKDIHNLVEYCHKQASPQFYSEIEIQTAAETAGAGKTREEEDYGDSLFFEAARMIIDTGQASTSFLQRRFRIGNPRAGRIMDILEENGIVSGPDGSRPRNVLMDLDQFNERFEK